MKIFCRRRALLLAAFLLSGLSSHAFSTIVTIDQQSTVVDAQALNGTVGLGIGQSFTPTLTSLNAATFSLQSNAATGSTMRLDLFSGAGFGGTLLGSSAPVTFNNTAAPQRYEFDFATAQTLIPNTVYTFRLTLTAGSTFYVDASINNPYSRGSYYANTGTAFPANDLAFVEGTGVVPEPSTWALLGVGAAGAGVVALGRRARRA